MSFSGPIEDMFGYTVQQFENNEGKWVLIGSPLKGQPAKRTGDVYRCPVGHGHSPSCIKLDLPAQTTIPNIHEVKENMTMGTTLVANPDGKGFLACGPQYGYMCGNQQYIAGICSNVSSSFKVLDSFSPTIRECQQDMDIVIVLDGSNSIFPWKHITEFLVKFLKKIEIPPARTLCTSGAVQLLPYIPDAHHVLLTREFLKGNNMTSLLYPPYSPDLASADFALKIQLKGRRFDTNAEIQHKLTHFVNKWQEHWGFVLLCKGTILKVGIVSYGQDAGHVFNLSQFSNTEDLVGNVSHIKQRGGLKTMTALGIDTARKEAFTAERGARPGVKKVMVIVTDGESHDDYKLKDVVKDCEKDGIERFAIAVLGDYNRQNKSKEQVDKFINQIKSIASNKTDDHFFNVEDERALITIVDSLGSKIFALEATSGNHTSSFEMEMSQSGFSAHTSRAGVMLGAVGAYDWNGTVVMQSDKKFVVPKNNAFHNPLVERYQGMAGYIGYDVQSAYTASGVLYITGAPRYNHTGRVIVYRFDGENVTVMQNLDGKQIGSYFGSVLQTLDVDNDSYTDLLLVGAPMFMGPERDEQGQVYVYQLNKDGMFELQMTLRPVNQTCTRENKNEPCGARFGTAIAAVPDLNLDGLSDVVIGSPLENDHKGAVYIYQGTGRTIGEKYVQRIASGGDGEKMKFFGQSIHGIMDLNDDGIIDVTIGGIGGAALYWSRDVAELHANMTFEPARINLQQPTCQIHGKDKVCVKTTVCFRYKIKMEKQMNKTLIHYTLTLDALRSIARGKFKDTDERKIQKNVTIKNILCNEHFFYICIMYFFSLSQDKLDFRDPLMVSLDFGLVEVPNGPVLDGALPTSLNRTLALVDCGNNEKCITDLHLEAKSNITSLIIKAYQEKFHVSIKIKNSGDNAYNTKVTLSTTENINYVKVEPKEKDCDLNHTKTICAVGYPFLKSNDTEDFKILFEVNPSHVRKEIVINVTATTDSEESKLSDNFVQITIPVKYEASLTFTAKMNMKEDHIFLKEGETAPSVINDTSMIGEEMNVTYTIERDAFKQSPHLGLTVTFPYRTQAENVLLYLTHLSFSSHIICTAHVNPLKISQTHQITRKAKAETLSSYLVSCDEKANPCTSFSCYIPSERFNQINVTFRVWKQTFIQGEFSSLFLMVHAKLESKDKALFDISQNDKSREVHVQISKESRSGIPLWIIILSILIGLLILALVIFCLWKFGFFKRKSVEEMKEDMRDS
ncbi:integrin alpha-1 isoform X2 [Silurus meridionalis]|nr:integrin alpha-1 isoform X2 [Silurus meridionalis]